MVGVASGFGGFGFAAQVSWDRLGIVFFSWMGEQGSKKELPSNPRADLCRKSRQSFFEQIRSGNERRLGDKPHLAGNHATGWEWRVGIIGENPPSRGKQSLPDRHEGEQSVEHQPSNEPRYRHLSAGHIGSHSGRSVDDCCRTP